MSPVDVENTRENVEHLHRRVPTNGFSRTAALAALAAAPLSLLLLAAPAAADPPAVQNRWMHIVEWDLPAPADFSPGAMIVDTLGDDQNRLWFVTRFGDQRVFRFDPAKSMMKGWAQWKSWTLSTMSDPPDFSTGGLKKIKGSGDRRLIFVRTSMSIQRIDTQNCDAVSCARTEWDDPLDLENVSDLAVDDRNNVFTTGSDDPTNPAASYVQMLTPGPYPGNGLSASASVTRWTVGGGAGFCPDIGSPGGTQSFPCVSGIAVNPTNRNSIFYSEPQGQDGRGNISELNISNGAIRRWPLATLPPDADGNIPRQPRQLAIDRWGVVWVITGSGHLVSVNSRNNLMRKHEIPMGLSSDTFGLAPDDDVIGYTDTGRNMVGMLFPKGPTFSAYPANASATRTSPLKTAFGQRANISSGSVPPDGKVIQATIYNKADGTFVEAQLNSAPPNDPTATNDSFSPLGITANKGNGEGTFFYAVGFAGSGANRIGFARMPMPQKVKHPRDNDDGEDGWDHNSHPNGWHMADDDDDDEDGWSNQYDSPTAREDVRVIDDPPPLAAGQAVDYPVTTSATSLALIAITKADDVLAQIGIEIYNPMGLLVASSIPTPGLAVATVALPSAGNYKVRVRNFGLTPITHTPNLIVREPWPLQ